MLRDETGLRFPCCAVQQTVSQMLLCLRRLAKWAAIGWCAGRDAALTQRRAKAEPVR